VEKFAEDADGAGQLLAPITPTGQKDFFVILSALKK
jgi:hypothetical protein